MEREREREGLSAVFFISIGDCLVVFDPIPFSIACLPHAVSALSLSLSHSQWAAARPAIGLDENRFFRCFVECRPRRRRFVYLSPSVAR